MNTRVRKENEQPRREETEEAEPPTVLREESESKVLEKEVHAGNHGQRQTAKDKNSQCKLKGFSGLFQEHGNSESSS